MEPPSNSSEPTEQAGHKPPLVECAPIKSYEELYVIADNLPSWYSKAIPIAQRSQIVVENRFFECHMAMGDCSRLPDRFDRNTVPKTIVCHDFKNGYLEDKFCTEVKIGNGYTFTNWQCIDMFIYFSHHFITVPPLPWINVAHKFGVQILGTIITEWETGEALCKQFLKDEDEVDLFVSALVRLNWASKTDGWLINIENKIDAEKVPMLVMFVERLTKAVHKFIKNGVVIWYDSVIETGELKWQNELNSKNRCFFDACDGIFLNYCWTEDSLAASLGTAGERCFDVYAGIDVFGRNTSYPAGFGCYKGLESARDLDMSVAIFAPGWTHESLDPVPVQSFFEKFILNDQKFWNVLFPYLYTHPVTQTFSTHFNLGASAVVYDLQQQSIQLSHRGCCLLTMVLGDCCLHSVHTIDRDVGDLTWMHLVVADIEVEGVYWGVIKTGRTRRTRVYDIDLVLVIEEDGRMRSDIPAPKAILENAGSARANQLIFAEWFFQFQFPKKARVKHFYARLPKAELLVCGLHFVKREE